MSLKGFRLKINIRRLLRFFLSGILFFILILTSLTIVFFINSFRGATLCIEDSIGDISNGVNDYTKNHNGNFPTSFLSISKEFAERFDKDYIIVSRPSPFISENDDRIYIALRVPYRTWLPFPFGMATKYCAISKRQNFMSITEDKFFSDLKSRKFSQWASNQTDTMNNLAQETYRFNFIKSFVPDVVYYTFILILLFLFFKRISRVVTLENKQFEALKNIFLRTSDSRHKNGQFLDIEENSFSDIIDNVKEYSERHSVQFIGDLFLKYDGRLIVASSSRSWKAPLCPFYGGKRTLILLEDGNIIKLKGISLVEGFYDRVKAAKNFFQEETKLRRKSDDAIGGASSLDVDAVSYSATSASTSLPAFLNLPKESAFSRTADALICSFLFGVTTLGVFITIFMVFDLFSLFRLLSCSCGALFPLPAILVAIPYWLFVSNYYAEY